MAEEPTLVKRNGCGCQFWSNGKVTWCDSHRPAEDVPPTFKQLGQKTPEFLGLETFTKPKGVTAVAMTSDEVTSLCPITGQPDFEVVVIEYVPNKLCLESKSLKLYFASLRQTGAFIEDLSAKIAFDVMEALDADKVQVRAVQKPRGGISISSVAEVIRRG